MLNLLRLLSFDSTHKLLDNITVFLTYAMHCGSQRLFHWTRRHDNYDVEKVFSLENQCLGYVWRSLGLLYITSVLRDVVRAHAEFYFRPAPRDEILGGYTENRVTLRNLLPLSCFFSLMHQLVSA